MLGVMNYLIDSKVRNKLKLKMNHQNNGALQIPRENDKLGLKIPESLMLRRGSGYQI